MGHPGLPSAQPDRREPLLEGEERSWYHLRVGAKYSRREERVRHPPCNFCTRAGSITSACAWESPRRGRN
jgi:hypothetical protein